jgi:hypothetical protein
MLSGEARSFTFKTSPFLQMEAMGMSCQLLSITARQSLTFIICTFQHGNINYKGRNMNIPSQNASSGNAAIGFGWQEEAQHAVMHCLSTGC